MWPDVTPVTDITSPGRSNTITPPSSGCAPTVARSFSSYGDCWRIAPIARSVRAGVAGISTETLTLRTSVPRKTVASFSLTPSTCVDGRPPRGSSASAIATYCREIPASSAAPATSATR